MQALSQTNAGDTCTIKWMFGIPEILETMRNMDIKEGSTIPGHPEVPGLADHRKQQPKAGSRQ